jgi:hypothetical protein
MGVKTALKKGISLTFNQKKAMYTLMTRYYDNLSFDKFIYDFEEKDDVIILVDEGEIYGFTTIELKEMIIDGKSIIGVFSGNTIVDNEYAFQSELQKGFTRYIENMINKEKHREIYWFLICKGYKTYRYLSVYFNDYYPNKDKPTPIFEQKVMDRYAEDKYGKAYDKTTGVIKNTGINDFLKEGVATIDKRVKKNKVNVYFEKVNHNHFRGDELVCLAKFSDENLKRAFYRATRGSQYESI